MSTPTKDAVIAAATRLLEVIRTVDVRDPVAARARLAAALPVDGPAVVELARLVRAGVDARVVCDRENDGVRFSRLKKAAGADDMSIDLVHMRGPGPGHTHPHGEIDLCFAVEGTPTFDGHPPGWTVYEPGSWHVPRVDGGAMDILYFLPSGAIVFEPRPAST